MTRRHGTLSMAIAGLAAALVIGGCAGGDDAQPADRGQVVTRLVDDVITPALVDAAAAVDTAEFAVVTYCASPTASTRAAAVGAVDDALSRWERLDLVDMGPLMLLRTDSHVGYPVDPEKVADLLADGPPQDVETVNDRTASSARGLTTAEHLLAVEPEPGADPARCAYLTAVAAGAADAVAEAVAESVTGTATADAYHERLAGRGPDPVDPGETIDVIVNMVLTVLEKDATLLGDPGEQSEATARRATVAHLATVRALWGEGEAGLGALVDRDLAETVAAELAAAESAVADPEVPAGEAQALVDEARATIGTEVVSALDVTIGFSDNDGDS